MMKPSTATISTAPRPPRPRLRALALGPGTSYSTAVMTRSRRAVAARSSGHAPLVLQPALQPGQRGDQYQEADSDPDQPDQDVVAAFGQRRVDPARLDHRESGGDRGVLQQRDLDAGQ